MTDKPQPVVHEDEEHRQMARRMRDTQWAFADLVAEHGTVWFCWWDKARRHHDAAKRAPNLYVTCLISGMEMLEWMRAHEDWWVIGKWDDARYAAPVELTEAGRAALANRAAYDMEPVDYGLVEPGHRSTPAERAA
jgi:hypothetical protein